MSLLNSIRNLRRPRNPDREEGVLYQHSVTNRYKAPEVTAAKIRSLEDNAYFVKLEQNQRNLVFCEKVEIVVKNPKGEIDEDLTEKLTAMTNEDDNRLNQKLPIIWSSVWRYGASFVNDVWGWRGSEYRLLALRVLPAYTFATVPTAGNYFSYGDILRGVVLNEDHEVEYWQKQDETGDPVQVKNITMIKDPTEPAIAGVPSCLPAVHIIHMLAYCHKAQMQKVNRVGAPALFPKVTSSVQRAKGIVSDANYLKTMLQNWGINVSFPLRENMEFADPHIEDNPTALDTIKHYEGILDRIYSPTSLITKDGTLIGGSNLGELELMKMYISSVHRWLEEAAESLLQHYLDVNGYTEKGYSVEVTLPAFEVDETPLNVQLVTAMRETPTSPALATLDEMRDLLGLPPADDKVRAELEKTRPQPQASPIPFGLKQEPHPKGVQTPEEVATDEADDLERAYGEAFEAVIAELKAMETG